MPSTLAQHTYDKLDMIPPFRAARSASAEKLTHLRLSRDDNGGLLKLEGVGRHTLSIHLGNGKIGIRHAELPSDRWTTVNAGLLGSELYLLRQYFKAAEVNRIPFPPRPERTDNYAAIMRAAVKVARFAEAQLYQLMQARNNARMPAAQRTKTQATRFANLFRVHEELVHAARAAFADLNRKRNPARGMPIPSELAAVHINGVVLALDVVKRDLDHIRQEHSAKLPPSGNNQSLRDAVLEARAAHKPLKPYVIKRAAKRKVVSHQWSPQAKARSRARSLQRLKDKRREDDRQVRADYEAARALAREVKKAA